MIRIRSINIEEDVDAFWGWFEMIVKMSIENKFYGKPMVCMLLMRTVLHNKIYAVFDDSTMIAYALCDVWGDTNNIMIAFMLVDSAFRKQGIGDKLLNHITECHPDGDIFTETNTAESLRFFNHVNFKVAKQQRKGSKFLRMQLCK